MSAPVRELLRTLAPTSAIALLALLYACAVWLPAHPLASLALAYGCCATATCVAAWVASRARETPTIAHTGIGILAAILLAIAGFVLSPNLDPWAAFASSAAVLLLGSTVGVAVGSRVPAASHLLVVALLSSAVDLWSALSPEGPTHALATTPDPRWLRVLAVSAAVDAQRHIEPMLGVGDGIFAGLYLAAAVKHRLSIARMSLAVWLGLIAAGAAVLLLRRPLPALPFVGFFVVIFHAEVRRVAREDRRATTVAWLALVAAIVRVAMRSVTGVDAG